LIISLIAVAAGRLNFKVEEGKGANHFAVLVAGSNGFWNYRHQSDVYHAYQILRQNGVPAENIITFAYDDIAKDSSNPFPGKVFNKPDPTGKGKDVYAGIKIDYSGADVTPANFINVLEGNTEKLHGIGSGKVLTSTKDDNIFVYFSDHGATGLVAFPSEELYAATLITTLKSMFAKKLYKEFVFYLEACESGSMFNQLLDEKLNIYATTASDPDTSSYATYCGPDDNVNGQEIGSCLGDEYSVAWLEDSDADTGLKKSLDKQYANTKTNTKQSAVQQYGSLSYKDKDIGQYQGNHSAHAKKSKTIKRFFAKVISKVKHLLEALLENKSETAYEKYLAKAKKSVVDSRIAKLEYLKKRATKLNTEESQKALHDEQFHVSHVDNIFQAFDAHFSLKATDKVNGKIHFDCLRTTVNAYKAQCSFGEYDLKFVRNMALACEKMGGDSKEVVERITTICQSIN